MCMDSLYTVLSSFVNPNSLDFASYVKLSNAGIIWDYRQDKVDRGGSHGINLSMMVEMKQLVARVRRITVHQCPSNHMAVAFPFCEEKILDNFLLAFLSLKLWKILQEVPPTTSSTNQLKKRLKSTNIEPSSWGTTASQLTVWRSTIKTGTFRFEENKKR